MDDPVLICPYNKSHGIIKSRMQFHLTKCRRQHPSTEKTNCPFNSTHIVLRKEYELHLQLCEDRLVDEAFLCSVGSSELPKVEFSTVPVTVVSDESWDVSEQAPVSVLDRVHEVVQTKATLQALIGAPKSERKAFRNQERKRIQQVLDSKEKEERDRCARKAKEGSGQQKGHQRESERQSEGRESPAEADSFYSLKERVEAEMALQEGRGRGAINATRAGQTTKSVKPIESFQRPQRNPRNPWGEQPGTSGRGDAPSWGEAAPAATSSASDAKFKPSTQIRERNPSNPWNVRKPPSSPAADNNNTMKQNEESGSSGGSDAPSSGEAFPAATSSASDFKFKPSTQAKDRDPSNPWKAKKPSTSTTDDNTSEPKAEEFPSLPVSGRGRGKNRRKK